MNFSNTRVILKKSSYLQGLLIGPLNKIIVEGDLLGHALKVPFIGCTDPCPGWFKKRLAEG